MCYPADHPNGNFIPQWSMWYVIELAGYFKRSGEKDKEKFKGICYGLVEYFKPFKNSDGLLEKLEKWNFVEWSDANKWVMDVNYPTNMLYSKMIQLIGTWYNDASLLVESERIKSKVIEQSFNGKWFIDNAVRDDDRTLKLTGNSSEVCQYYAFFFGVANENDEKFAYLKELVLNVFGPERKAKGIMPEIVYANAFIGNYLRMEILLRWREYRKIVNEVKSYFYNMAKTTGTLWEHDRIIGSLNHGFASYAGVTIIKAIFGIQDIDLESKSVTVDSSDIGLDTASCSIGTPYGEISVRFNREGDKLQVVRSIPKEFKVIENLFLWMTQIR
jgi:alpha-L-rhamnosidase